MVKRLIRFYILLRTIQIYIYHRRKFNKEPVLYLFHYQIMEDAMKTISNYCNGEPILWKGGKF